ncbi:hypothetical protein LINPERHAP2_LOCUS1264 [Linum perenne]
MGSRASKVVNNQHRRSSGAEFRQSCFRWADSKRT